MGSELDALHNRERSTVAERAKIFPAVLASVDMQDMIRCPCEKRRRDINKSSCRNTSAFKRRQMWASIQRLNHKAEREKSRGVGGKGDDAKGGSGREKRREGLKAMQRRREQE
eukprot:755670-Hanusia_phi.AAC.1